MARSTWETYRRALQKFKEFRGKLGWTDGWPLNTGEVVAFVAQLCIEGLAASSINTYISAISFVHKINDWADPTSSFIITKLREGCKRLRPQSDSRYPITLPILQRIVSVLPSVCASTYEVILFRAAFLLAFFGFLRVSEFTCEKNQVNTGRTLSLRDVHLEYGDQPSMHLKVKYSKTDQQGHAVTVIIAKFGDITLCPVKAMSEYLAVRAGNVDPLFIHFNKEPLTARQVTHIMRRALEVVGVPQQLFSSHSFRIGAATSAAMCGFSDEWIKAMGRWKSSAFKLYIRPERLISGGVHVGDS